MVRDTTKAKSGIIGKVAGLFGGRDKEEEAPPPPPPKLTPEELAPNHVDPDEGKIWPAKRLNVVEKLWGEGYLTPGGTDEVKKLLPLLALDKKKSLLLLGAGLGGINETMVEETGVWVTGLERSPELATLGFESMKRASLQKQAPIHHSTMETMELKPKSFDVVLSFDGLYAVQDKKALFATVCEGLRVDGELRFTDLVLPDTNPPGEKVKEWISREPAETSPHPWPADALQALLGSLNFDVRPYDDITAEYKKWVMTGFMRFMSSMTKTEMLEMAQELMTEVEFWSARIAAIDAGELKVCRYHAIRLPDKKKRKSVEELTG